MYVFFKLIKRSLSRLYNFSKSITVSNMLYRRTRARRRRIAVYSTTLERWRTERYREFESLRLRKIMSQMCGHWAIIFLREGGEIRMGVPQFPPSTADGTSVVRRREELATNERLTESLRLRKVKTALHAGRFLLKAPRELAQSLHDDPECSSRQYKPYAETNRGAPRKPGAPTSPIAHMVAHEVFFLVRIH